MEQSFIFQGKRDTSLQVGLNNVKNFFFRKNNEMMVPCRGLNLLRDLGPSPAHEQKAFFQYRSCSADTLDQ
jgi:hypothetical protein